MNRTSIRNVIKNPSIKVHLKYFTFFEIWKSICLNCESLQFWNIWVVGRMWTLRFHIQILVETYLIDPIPSLYNIYSTIRRKHSIWKIDDYRHKFVISENGSKIFEIIDRVTIARISVISPFFPRYFIFGEFSSTVEVSIFLSCPSDQNFAFYISPNIFHFQISHFRPKNENVRSVF